MKLCNYWSRRLAVRSRRLAVRWVPLFKAAFAASFLVPGAVWAQSSSDNFGRVVGPPFFRRPIEAVAASPSALGEGALLQQAVASTQNTDPAAVADLLVAFLNEYTNSVWGDSLRANLARFYYNEGRYTLALNLWEQAWEDTKGYPSGPGKRIADDVLAQWTRLLVQLGRMDQLSLIFTEARGRIMDGGPLAQKFIRTQEIYGFLQFSAPPRIAADG